MSFTCQSNFGPSFGHCLSRPVSREIPLRSGPRHCGHSETVWARVVTDKQKSAAMAARDREVIVFSLSTCRGNSAVDVEFWTLFLCWKRKEGAESSDECFGGAEGDRTPDLMTASAVRSS